jgi:hypothetical protein
MSMFSAARKKVTDVRSFLRQASSGSGIKYSAEAGKKHLIYFPCHEEDVVGEDGSTTKELQLYAISGAVHEWKSADGKFHSTMCLKDVVREDENGNLINDGSCPFCDRVRDSWSIYNYRKDLEEANCKLTGENRTKHLEATSAVFRDEMKCKEAKAYMYVLVAKIKYENNKAVVGSDGVPEYELKVMRMSASRVAKIQEQIENSGIDLCGAELIFAYPQVDDVRLVVGQSTVSPVFGPRATVDNNEALKAKIIAEADKFDWEACIEKAFPEWAGMTSVQAKNDVTDMFTQWDEYQKLLKNPVTAGTAKYLEYVGPQVNEMPSLNGTGVANGAPAIGAPAPAVPMPSVPVPNVGTPAPAVPEVPDVNAGVPNVDPNSMFSGSTPSI